jgi:hypothetical protein
MKRSWKLSLGLATVAIVFGLAGAPAAKAQEKKPNILVALWKDADPDIPILKEAKAEYAKLQ